MSHEGNPTCQELQGGRQMDQERQDRAKGRGKKTMLKKKYLQFISAHSFYR